MAPIISFIAGDLKNSGLLEVSDQNDIRRPQPPRAGQIFAVARPVEAEDAVGLELGQQFRLAAAERKRDRRS